MAKRKISKSKIERALNALRYSWLNSDEMEELIALLTERLEAKRKEENAPDNPKFPPKNGPKQWLEEKKIGNAGPYLYLRYEHEGRRKSKYLKGLKRGDAIPWLTFEDLKT
ncbi:MAG: hypothetical protein U0350_05980 [Caldilineaceae bacterium]